MTAMNTDDRLQIHEALALHAHLADENQLDRFDELFTPDAVYDMSASGLGVFEGIETIRAAAAEMSRTGHSPLAHFLTNVVITSTADGEATARSKCLMIMADGQLHAVTYDDVLAHHDGAWRLSRRIITPAQSPIHTA
jgi:3-phenylpropionate/cinnamic acid dioxygenase small subunit